MCVAVRRYIRDQKPHGSRTNDIRRVNRDVASGDEPSIIAFLWARAARADDRVQQPASERRGSPRPAARSAAAPVARRVAPDQALKRDSRAGRLDWVLSSDTVKMPVLPAGRFAMPTGRERGRHYGVHTRYHAGQQKAPHGALSRCLPMSSVFIAGRSLALWKRQTASPAFRLP